MENPVSKHYVASDLGLQCLLMSLLLVSRKEWVKTPKNGENKIYVCKIKIKCCLMVLKIQGLDWGLLWMGIMSL